MSADLTRKRILDTAEHLFARHGFHRISLRDITREAGVNTASVNYHFGNRESLVREVIERRLIPVNSERIRRLDALQARDDDSISVQSILRAFVEPSVKLLTRDPAARDFVGIIGQGMADPDETIKKVFMEQVRPVFARMAVLLARAMPHVPQDTINLRLHCFIGAFAHCMRMMGVQSLHSVDGVPGIGSWQNDVMQSADHIMNSMMAFCVAGMEAPP